MRLDMLVSGYRSMLGWYEEMGPMQNKLFKYVQHELDGLDESDGWKQNEDEDEENDFFPGSSQ